MNETATSIPWEGGLVRDRARGPHLRVHHRAKAWGKPGYDDRDRGVRLGSGFHLAQVGLAIMIWLWLHGYKYTVAVAVATVWAIEMAKAVGL